MAKYILQEILRWLEGLFSIMSNYRRNWIIEERNGLFRQSPRRNDADI